MSNATGKNADAPLAVDLLADLRRVVDSKIHDNIKQCAEDIGVGKTSLLRAVAGQPLRPATAKVIAAGLAKLRAESNNAVSRAAPGTRLEGPRANASRTIRCAHACKGAPFTKLTYAPVTRSG